MTSTAPQARAREGNALWLVLLTALSILLNYIDRGAIGIAAPLMKTELGLSATTFGLAVSAFFWTYVPANLLVGWLSDRVCVFRLFAAGVFIWALSTLLTGWVSGLVMLVVLRLMLGIGESIAFPGSSKILATQVPPTHRGIANAVITAAVGFGPALGALAGGMILAKAGWRPIFWVFGAVTLLWLVPWHLVTAPYRARQRSQPPLAPQPLAPLLRVPALWLMGIAHFCGNYPLYFSLTWMPLYLTQVRGYSIGEMTAIASLGFIGPAFAPVVGRWSDVLIARGVAEDLVRRRLMIMVQLGGVVSLAGIALSQSTAALVFWVVFSGLTSSGGSNLFAVGQIFGGARATGAWIGVQNTIGNFSGIVGPVVTGLIIDRLGGYGWGFALAGAIALLGAFWWWRVIPPIREVTISPAGTASGPVA